MPPAKFFAALILTPLLAIAAPAPITLPQIQTQAQQGDPEAQARLGEAYLNGNFGIAQAAAYYQQADQNNDITGQYRLAKLYEQGLGVPRDFAQARALYLKHTTRQDYITAPSFQALGDLYRYGLGVNKNPREAQKWYRLAKQSAAVK